MPGIRLVAALVFACLAGTWPVEAQTIPSRIVSTSPSITETLFALGLGNRVVGVSIYCRFPEEVTRLPKVGTFMKPDAELIAGLRPDLVLVHPAADGLDRRLTSIGVRAEVVGQGTSMPNVFGAIRKVGSATNVPERGEQLVGDIQRTLDMIRAEGQRARRPRVLFIIGRRPGLLTDLVGIGPGSYLDELIGIAGGINVLAIAGQPEYPRISMETVLRLDPDVIIDTVDMGDTDAERAERKPVNERLWRAYPGLKAVRGGRVRAATTDALVIPGPRVVDAARWVVEQLREVASP